MSANPSSRRKSWVLDYETICNTFVVVCEDLFSKEQKVFIIWKHVNHLSAFLKFIDECRDKQEWHLGYNILNFDSQITEWISVHRDFLLSLKTGEQVAREIYAYAQRVIENSNAGERPDYPEYNLSIKCQDIYRMNNWDSNAKRTSLKWVQFAMDWENVEEMPHPHYEEVENQDVLTKVISYCLNDVSSTKAVYLQNKWDKKKGKYEFEMLDQIALRTELSKTYNLELYSAPEPRISKQVFLHFLSEKLRKKKWDINKLRTHRNTVNIGDIILPYVKFATPEFRDMFNWFKSQVVDTRIYDESQEKKSKLKFSVMHKGVKTDYGLGGLHGCVPSGVYKKGNGKIILSADVTSFYPNLAIRNKWAPLHLPKQAFCELYEWFFETRKTYPKGSPLNYLFKIILNATYGLSKNKHSFLYDPEFTFRITINGQLLLSMLYEMISTRIPGSQPLMQNTDGLEFMIDEQYRPQFEAICKEWEKMTQLELEFVEYERMIIGDVNNYIAIDTSGKTKCKGRFEFEDLPLHKNKSHLIVPKALYNYFVNGIKPEDFLKSNRNIFDYCGGVKLRGDWRFESVYVDNNKDREFLSWPLQKQTEFLRSKGWRQSWSDNNWVHTSWDNQEANNGLDTLRALQHEFFKESRISRKLEQKMIRYYNSKRGSKLVKVHADGREIQLESGKVYQTIFNRYEKKEWEEYGVDEGYYLRRIRNEIQKIEEGKSLIQGCDKKQQQLTLF